MCDVDYIGRFQDLGIRNAIPTTYVVYGKPGRRKYRPPSLRNLVLSLIRILYLSQGLYPALIVVLVDFQKSVWYRPHVGAESQVDSRYGSQFHFSSTAGSRAVGVDLSSGSAGSSDYYTLTTIKQTSFGGSTN